MGKEVDEIFGGIEVDKKTGSRFDDERIKEAVKYFDKYKDLYDKYILSSVPTSSPYCDVRNLFLVSLIFTWVDSSISDDEYIQKTRKMINDFTRDRSKDPSLLAKYQDKLDDNVILNEMEPEVEPYLDMIIYFRNASLRSFEKRKMYMYTQRDTQSVMLLVCMQQTIETMLEKYPLYVNKLRKTPLKSYAEDAVNNYLDVAYESLAKELKDKEFNPSKYASGITLASQNYLGIKDNRSRQALFAQKYTDKLNDSYRPTNKFISLEVEEFIYGEYKAFCTTKLDFNNLPDDLDKRARDNGEVFAFENINNTDYRARKDLGILNWYDSIFIDGKPLISYIPNKYKSNIQATNRYAHKVMYETLIKSDKIIDKVTFVNINGNILTKVQPIYSTSRLDDEAFKETFGWFRRLLDTLHIYKIPTVMDVENERIEKEKATNAKRNAKINRYIERKYINPKGYTLVNNSQDKDMNLNISSVQVDTEYSMVCINHTKSLVALKDEIDNVTNDKDDLQSCLSEDLNIINTNAKPNLDNKNDLDISNEIFEDEEIITTSSKELKK